MGLILSSGQSSSIEPVVGPICCGNHRRNEKRPRPSNIVSLSFRQRIANPSRG
jgi:hypothetical protein